MLYYEYYLLYYAINKGYIERLIDRLQTFFFDFS